MHLCLIINHSAAQMMLKMIEFQRASSGQHVQAKSVNGPNKSRSQLRYNLSCIGNRNLSLIVFIQTNLDYWNLLLLPLTCRPVSALFHSSTLGLLFDFSNFVISLSSTWQQLLTATWLPFQIDRKKNNNRRGYATGKNVIKNSSFKENCKL